MSIDWEATIKQVDAQGQIVAQAVDEGISWAIAAELACQALYERGPECWERTDNPLPGDVFVIEVRRLRPGA